MATAVFFHAHPDDEAIATGGTMVLGAQSGHRIVLVCATDGAVGEADPSAIPDGETLADVRARELMLAADELLVDRLEMLGYRDSGMRGTDTNDDPDCFWQADVDEAAGRLAQILREEDASIVTIYDPIGGYNHPDHIQVHRVGKRAAELAGTPHVFESTMNREQMRSFGDDPAWAEMAEGGGMSADEIEAERNEFLEQDLGTPAADIKVVRTLLDVVRGSLESIPRLLRMRLCWADYVSTQTLCMDFVRVGAAHHNLKCLVQSLQEA